MLEKCRYFTVSSTTFKDFSVSAEKYTQSIQLEFDSSSTVTSVFEDVTFQCNDDSEYTASGFKSIVDSNYASLTSSSPIMLISSKMDTKNCVFKNCKNANKGGVIYVGSGSTLSDTGSTFTHNLAKDGGVIFAEKGIISLANSIFVENYAVSGGAIELTSESTSGTIINTNFTSNYASSQGGAMTVISSSTLKITSAVFNTNTAPDSSSIYALNTNSSQ